MSKNQGIQCYVYKGNRKDDHFLFLRDPLSEVLAQQESSGETYLPDALLLLLGDLEFVVEFDLTPDKKLPQSDAQQILKDLATQGFYLQMPKTSVDDLEDIYFN